MNRVLKTSEQWAKSPEYMGLTILDADGWDRHPDEFEFQWFKELIDKNEFERRLCTSTIKWSLPKL